VLSERVFSALLFFLTLAVYLLLPIKDFYWDGISFAIDIEKAAALLHPNHLIYNLVGYWLYQALRTSGHTARALYVLQTMDSVFAAASVVLVYHIQRKSAERENSAVLALLFAFSATWWKFAADADAYIASVFFLLVAYSLLLAEQPRPLSIAVAHAIAMLFHQLAVFFFPVAVYSLYRKQGLRLEFPHSAQVRSGTDDRSLSSVVKPRQTTQGDGLSRLGFSPRKQGLRAAMQYAILAFLLTAGVYGLAYRSGHRAGSPASFLDWITAHSPGSQWSFRVAPNLGATLLGNAQLLLGGKLAGLDSGWIAKAGAALLVAALLLSLKHVRAAWTRPAVSRAPLWIWIAAYSLFLFFFEPRNTFYRLFYLPALIFLLGSRLRGAVGLAVASVFLWNFTFLIYPRSKPESNETLAFALRERPGWPAGSGIVYHVFHPDLWTIAYFNWQASWIGLSSADIPKLESYRSDFERDGRSLWLEQTAVDLLDTLPEGQQWLTSHVRTADAIRYQSKKRSFAFYRVSAPRK
jgi:hypothetical protein